MEAERAASAAITFQSAPEVWSARNLPMIEKDYSIVINRPIHEVFEYATDSANIPE
ncbi:MAG: hypothetical protein GTN51_06315 [Armatimonadetes bacterium]|nr:hypothetical protein [Armatimonadota bacterium]